MDFSFWFGLASFGSSLLLVSFGYGQLRKEVQTALDDIEKLNTFKEAQMKSNATFNTREDSKNCQDMHKEMAMCFATREELAATTERIRDSLFAISDRIKEDREKNNTQHKEFYSTDDKVISMSSSLTDLQRRMGSVEGDTKSILAIVTALQAK